MGVLAQWMEAEFRGERRPDGWPAAGTAPEDVFLIWLMGLPQDADVAEAARREIARLDQAAPLSPGAARLRELMRQAADARLRSRGQSRRR